MALAEPALLGREAPRRPGSARASARWPELPGAPLALGALAAAGALVLAGALGFAPDNDGYARLARAVAAPPWLVHTQTKPLEIFLARLVAALPVDPLLAWRTLGALHVGLCGALVVRIVAHSPGGAPASRARRGMVASGGLTGVAAAGLAVSAPLFLEHALAMNSVATLTAALLLWVERSAAGDPRGRGAALALVALARLDGLLLAGLLAAASATAGPRDARAWRRSLLLDAGALVVAASLWLATDRVANGRWLGFLILAREQFEILPPPRFDLPGMARWLRAAWLSHAGESVLFLTGIGAALAARRRGRALTSPVRALALALAAHHAVLVFLGMTGRSLLYRYFVPDLVLGLVLAALGFRALARSIVPASAPLRGPLVAALALLGFGGALLDVRGLADAAREVRSRRAVAAAAESCLAPWLGEAAGHTLVVPSGLHGELLWRLREVAVAELLYEEWFVAARARTRALPVRSGEAGQTVLWLGDEGDAVPAIAAGLVIRGLARCEGAAAPLAVRLLAPRA